MIFKKNKKKTKEDKEDFEYYTNKNIEVGVKNNLFNTKYSVCVYTKDHSQLVYVYYNDVEIGIMQETFKFREYISKEDRKKLKPMVFEYLKHCYLVKKENKLKKEKDISNNLWSK